MIRKMVLSHDSANDVLQNTYIRIFKGIENFKEKSVLPVVDMLSCVEIEVRNRGYKKIGILGTKPVMESKFYSVITSAEVILPEGNLLEEVHKSYVDMATLGSANDEQRKVFELACNQFLKINISLSKMVWRNW